MDSFLLGDAELASLDRLLQRRAGMSLAALAAAQQRRRRRQGVVLGLVVALFCLGLLAWKLKSAW